MKFSLRKPPLTIALIMAASLAAFTGCSLQMDSPAKGVQIRIEKPISDDIRDDFQEQLKALVDDGSHSFRSVTVNDKMTMNLSPVADAKTFADKIDFAKVVKIEGNVIWLETLDD